MKVGRKTKISRHMVGDGRSVTNKQERRESRGK